MGKEKHGENIDAVKALYEVSLAVASSLDISRVVSETLGVLARTTGFERGMLVLRDPETGGAGIEAAHGLSEEEIRRGKYVVGEGVVGRVMETGQPMVVPNVGKEPLFLDRTRSRGDIRRTQISFICVPVKLGNETVGALAVDRIFDDRIDLEEDVRILSIVAGYVGQAVRIRRMVESETSRLTDENILLKRALAGEYRPENMVGQSDAMRAVFDQIMMVARSRATVLITGESGTGKELVAKALHSASDRKDKPFIGISCAGIPETMMENELFGHERGAFTGAVATQKGRFELAHEGTVFLDEVGEIPLSIQVKLLRVIQEREIERLGGKETIKLDVRLVAATNRDLAAEMRAGKFREDLYYRLNVIPIHLPPLRERINDITLLADHFLRRFASENEKPIKGISREAMAMMTRYPWPGNVRELENLVQRMVIMDSDGIIGADDLPASISAREGREPPKPDRAEPGELEKASRETAAPLFSAPPEKGVFSTVVDRVEDELVREALRISGGVKLEAARLLGINRNTLYAKIKRLGIK